MVRQARPRLCQQARSDRRISASDFPRSSICINIGQARPGAWPISFLVAVIEIVSPRRALEEPLKSRFGHNQAPAELDRWDLAALSRGIGLSAANPQKLSRFGDGVSHLSASGAHRAVPPRCPMDQLVA
jgi:hypothetical protein